MTVHRWDFFWPVSKLQGAQLADLGTAEINMTAETVRIQLWRGDELVVEGNGYFAQGTTHDGRFDAEIRWDTASIVSDDG